MDRPELTEEQVRLVLWWEKHRDLYGEALNPDDLPGQQERVMRALVVSGATGRPAFVGVPDENGIVKCFKRHEVGPPGEWYGVAEVVNVFAWEHLQFEHRNGMSFRTCKQLRFRPYSPEQARWIK